MPRDIYTYQKFLRWFQRRQSVEEAWEQQLRASRHASFRRTGPTSRFFSYRQQVPGESE